MSAELFLPFLSPDRQKHFLALAGAYGKSYMEGQKVSDPRVLSLPHHKRIMLNESIEKEAAFLAEFAPEVIETAKMPFTTRHDIANAMLTFQPDMAATIYKGRFDVLCDIGLRLMVLFKRIRMFQTTDALETMLLDTDFGDDIPASWFQTPFDNIYIEFGEHRRSPFTIEDPNSGTHIVEGCYLLKGLAKPMSGRGQMVRGYDLIIFGSPLNKSGVLDDCFVHMALPIEDENTSISSLVSRVVAMYAAQAEFVNADVFRPVVEHVAKILVYMGTKEARQREVIEGRLATDRIKALKSSAKREKARRQAERLYDRIVIGPSAVCGADQSGGSGIRAHVRRGHFRSQPCGPNHSLRRPVWIQPTLVGGAQLGADILQPTYRIQ